MKHLFLICSLLSLSLICKGQDTTSIKRKSYPYNSIFFELTTLNTHYFGSINYERVFLHANFFYLSGRIGIGYGKTSDHYNPTQSLVSVPILINGIFQIYHSFALEMGAGISPRRIGTPDEVGSSVVTYDYMLVATGNIGIRIQTKSGILLKTDIEPFFDGDKIAVAGGLSFGLSFGN